MAFSVFISDEKKWQKDCDKIPEDHVQKIVKRLRLLEEDPWPANIQVQQLKEYPLADFRMRIGAYRVLFNMDAGQKVIRLLRVLHRSKLY